MIEILKSAELSKRIALSKERLSSKEYAYPGIFNNKSDWPGDWEGRAILSLTMLYHAVDSKKDKSEILTQLKEIFDHIEEHLNKFYYFGSEMSEDIIDEQQLSGNSWYIRGLINYYLITKDEKYLNYLRVIKDNFVAKTISFYEKYPLCKREFGDVGGHLLQESVDGWKLSSDIGCAYIFFDALTNLYSFFKEENLKVWCDRVFESFKRLNYIALECQTHATLSFTRGVIRLYKETHEEKYLNKAIQIFNDYINFGMTKDYSNMNWFNRPNTWTEPCCIVDSLICSDELFKLTDDFNYLHLANRIYLNAFRGAQRTNGGAGCNTCLINDNKILKVHLYEAYFCCTMRFPEGLNYTKDNLVVRKDDKLLIQFFEDFIYEDDKIKFSVKGNPYLDEKVVINVEKLAKPQQILIYSTEKGNYRELVEVKDTGVYKVKIDFALKKENAEILYGDMVLTKKNFNDEDDNKTFVINNEKYTYIYNFIDAKNKSNELKIVQEI